MNEIENALRLARRQRADGGFNNGQDILEKAKKAYPFIERHNPYVKVSPRDNAGYAETFGPDEPGAGDFTRPSEFPMGATGIEIYRPNEFSEHDLAAEFLHVDPRANETRQALAKTLTPSQLDILRGENDYQDSMKQGLPEQKGMNNAIDSLMRGYTVGQWPAHAIQSFGLDDNQRKILDDLKRYMTTPNTPAYARGGDVISNALRLTRHT